LVKRGGQFRAQDLDGDRAVVLQVPSQVDRGHAARPEFSPKGVAAGRAAFF